MSRRPTCPTRGRADRPAEIAAASRTGARLGFQGPDQGYALRLAALVRPEVVVQPGESLDDAIAGCTAIALRRASLYGRAPVMADVRLALTIWGFFDPDPPGDLVGLRTAGLRRRRRHAPPLRGAAGARRLGAGGDSAPDAR